VKKGDKVKKSTEDKIIPRKAAKRLDWKRKQKEKKLERVLKQKAAKVAKGDEKSKEDNK
jgi:hypothetical protein